MCINDKASLTASTVTMRLIPHSPPPPPPPPHPQFPASLLCHALSRVWRQTTTFPLERRKPQFGFSFSILFLLIRVLPGPAGSSAPSR